MKKYNIALVGCGWIGMGAQLDLVRIKPASHAEAISCNTQLKLMGVIDNDASALAWKEKLYPEVPHFIDAKALCAYKLPDAVVIATHPDTHCFYIEQFVEQGVKYIVCEKPIADSLEETERIIKLCKKKKVELIVNHMRRFDSLIKQFKEYVSNEYVRDTAIGKVYAATASYDHGVFHGGTHIVDLLRYFLGEVKSVSAVKNHLLAAPHGDINVSATLHFETATASLFCVDSNNYSVGEISLIGEKGKVNLNSMWGLEIEVVGSKSSDFCSTYREPDYINKKTYGKARSFMVGTYEHLLNCLKGREVNLCSGEDALKTLRVLMALQESAEKNGLLLKVQYK